MRLFMHYFVLAIVLIFSLGYNNSAVAQVTTLVCNFETGEYFTTVKIDINNKILTKTDEIARHSYRLSGQKYDPDKHFDTFSIVYVSESQIRTNKVRDIEIEIDRRTLRMVWFRSTTPKETYLICSKAEKAF